MEGPGIEPDAEAEFTLKTPASCSRCGESLDTVQVVRLLRTKVNFVSSLPRRGQVMIGPRCRGILAGSLGGVL